MSNIVPFAEIKQMSVVLGNPKMFGKNPDEMLALMLIAQAQGIHPAKAAMEYDMIQGRPAINSKSALSRFQHAGGKIQWTKRTDSECSAIFAHPQGGELEVTWSMERAKQAQLTGKDNWKKYPAQMLSARVIAEGVRAVFPACLDGLYTSEEVADFQPENVSKLNLNHNTDDIIIPKKEAREVTIIHETVEPHQVAKPKMSEKQVAQLVGKIKDNCHKLYGDPEFNYVEANHELFEKTRAHFLVDDEELAEIFSRAEVEFQAEGGVL